MATEQGFALYQTMGILTLGWARVVQSRLPEALEGMRRGMDLQPRLGACRTVLDAMLADACAEAGQGAEALETLQAGLARIRASDAHGWEPELNRLRGDMLLACGAPELEAQRCYARAIHVAEERESLSLQLRAAVSMSRLRTHQGRSAEGLAVLAAVYAHFTEGFDTVDLREASAILGSA